MTCYLSTGRQALLTHWTLILLIVSMNCSVSTLISACDHTHQQSLHVALIADKPRVFFVIVELPHDIMGQFFLIFRIRWDPIWPVFFPAKKNGQIGSDLVRSVKKNMSNNEYSFTCRWCWLLVLLVDRQCIQCVASVGSDITHCRPLFVYKMLG